MRRNIENSDFDAGRPAYEFFDTLFFAIDAPYLEDVGVDPGFGPALRLTWRPTFATGGTGTSEPFSRTIGKSPGVSP